MIEYLKADWQGLADVQLATLNWVDWFNKKRVHSARACKLFCVSSIFYK
ncbi:putative insB [Acinetobacter baumannii 4749]|nr:putative insB [Acinetobacter baumannii 4749]